MLSAQFVALYKPCKPKPKPKPNGGYFVQGQMMALNDLVVLGTKSSAVKALVWFARSMLV